MTTPKLIIEQQQKPASGLTTAEIVAELESDIYPDNLPILFHFLATKVFEARLANGARVLDASDFAEWLKELGLVMPEDVRVEGWR